MGTQLNPDFMSIQQDHSDRAGPKTYHLKEWEVALKSVSAVFSSNFSASAKRIGKLQETTWKTADSLKEKINSRSRCCPKNLAVSDCQQAADLEEASGASMGSDPKSKPPVSLWITLITCEEVLSANAAGYTEKWVCNGEAIYLEHLKHGCTCDPLIYSVGLAFKWQPFSLTFTVGF